MVRFLAVVLRSFPRARRDAARITEGAVPASLKSASAPPGRRHATGRTAYWSRREACLIMVAISAA